MLSNLLKMMFNKYIRFFSFAIVVTAFIYCLGESGILGGKYSYGPGGTKPDLNSVYLSIGTFLGLSSILINPFFNTWLKYSSLDINLEKSTGLHEYHWAQARAIISKHGKEALIILALRSSDDFLSDNQRLDFKKSRLAAEFYLEAAELEKYDPDRG